MIKTITIGDQQVELSGSAGWLYTYRSQFGHDILPDLMPIIESALEVIIKILGEVEGDKLEVRHIINAIDDDTLVSIIIDLSGMETTTMLNIFWAMAKKADKTIESPEDYFDRFDVFPLDEILPEMFGLIVESSISSKNVTRLLEGMSSLKSQVKQISTDSQSQEPKEG